MAFRIIRDDITRVRADAIVNTANPEPVFAGGTDAAVYEAAGVEALLAERKKIGAIQAGEAHATPAFALPADYVIHTVSPFWVDGARGERETLRQCYDSSLRLAVELGLASIAFPLLGAGVCGFPKKEAVQIALSAFRQFFVEYELEIILVVFGREAVEAAGSLHDGLEAYIDDHFAEKRLRDEYRMDEAMAPDRGRRRSRLRMGDALPMMGQAARPQAGQPMAAMASMPLPEPAGKRRSLEELMAQVSESWQESLFRLIDQKGYTDSEVYKRANVDRKLFSKIRNNRAYQPKKSTAVALAIALRLNLDETKDFLARAGYALSTSSKSDIIVEYFIGEGIYDIYEIEMALFDHELPLLGA